MSRRPGRYGLYRFDEIIHSAGINLGRQNIDATKLRNHHFEAWSRQLAVVPDGTDIEAAAERLVEHVLVTDYLQVFPVTTGELMELFSIPPGPDMGEILKFAQVEFQRAPCSREQRLELIRKERDSPTNTTVSWCVLVRSEILVLHDLHHGLEVRLDQPPGPLVVSHEL